MVSHLYRFRSTKQLLDGFNEPDAQQIYFAPPEDLNDPIETFKDLVWTGDEIVWRNLLRHYILIFIEATSRVFSGVDCDRNQVRSFVSMVPDNLPPAPVREIYDRSSNAFLNEMAVRKLVELMAGRTSPIRRYELTNYLRSLHPFAMDAVFKEYAAHGIMAPPSFLIGENLESMRANAIKMMESAALLPAIENASETAAEAFFAANDSAVDQLQLIARYQKAGPDSLVYLCLSFPSTYVGALDKLVHPDWYVACFSANPTNASMWGAYGDGHRGACLKFRTTPNSLGAPTLSLNTVTGLGGFKDRNEYYRSFVPTEFCKVQYSPAYPAVDFFRTLGSISLKSLNGFWYKGDDGRFSSCRETAFKDQAARDEYWRTFESSLVFKTAEWAHEEEYRLLLHSGFDLREKPMRTLQYKFEDLSGIILGARTDMADRLRIMKIIDQKCSRERRSDFEFFEVRYAPGEAAFNLQPLGLLKIKYD